MLFLLNEERNWKKKYLIETKYLMILITDKKINLKEKHIIKIIKKKKILFLFLFFWTKFVRVLLDIYKTVL